MSYVDSTLRHNVWWKYLIATDFTSAFHKIPLHLRLPEVQRVLVYSQYPVGMPGSESSLEELLVLGHLLDEHVLAKTADDLEETHQPNGLKIGIRF